MKLFKVVVSDVKIFFLVLIVSVIFRVFVVEVFFVPTGSMKPSIFEGDYIVSTKFDYGYAQFTSFLPDFMVKKFCCAKPKRGDVIVLKPSCNTEERYVKRLIGLPGDKIQVMNDLIYINDFPIERFVVNEFYDNTGELLLKFEEVLPNGVRYYVYKVKRLVGTNYGPKFIDSGNYFFMGDNRDDSLDSRYSLGTIPIENFVAKSRLVLFSFDKVWFDSDFNIITHIGRFFTWLASVKFDRILLKL